VSTVIELDKRNCMCEKLNKLSFSRCLC